MRLDRMLTISQQKKLEAGVYRVKVLQSGDSAGCFMLEADDRKAVAPTVAMACEQLERS